MRKGTKHSKETIKKISDNHADVSGINNSMYGRTGDKHPMYGKRGKDCPNWKGGITALYPAIHNLPESVKWRKDVKVRDNFICQYCSQYGGDLESHHIVTVKELIKKYNIKKAEDTLQYLQWFDINNGITYCVKCHNLLKNKGGLLN